MNQNITKIATFFRKYRLKSNLSPEQVAEQLGFPSVEQFLALENGQTKISTADVFSLVNLYNIPPDEVLSLFYDLAADSDIEAEEDCG